MKKTCFHVVVEGIQRRNDDTHMMFFYKKKIPLSIKESFFLEEVRHLFKTDKLYLYRQDYFMWSVDMKSNQQQGINNIVF